MSGLLPDPHECVFSPDRKHRYVLKKGTPEKGSVLWIMLNPSTADEQKLDPTLKRCWHFTTYWGYSQMVICNLFAFRSPHPKVMQEAEDPIGPENDDFIQSYALSAKTIMVAWGTGGHFMERASIVTSRLTRDHDLFCLGLTQFGDPKHPLARGKHRVPDYVHPLAYA